MTDAMSLRLLPCDGYIFLCAWDSQGRRQRQVLRGRAGVTAPTAPPGHIYTRPPSLVLARIHLFDTPHYDPRPLAVVIISPSSMRHPHVGIPAPSPLITSNPPNSSRQSTNGSTRLSSRRYNSQSPCYGTNPGHHLTASGPPRVQCFLRPRPLSYYHLLGGMIPPRFRKSVRLNSFLDKFPCTGDSTLKVMEELLLVLVKILSIELLKISPFVGALLVCRLLLTFDHGFQLCIGPIQFGSQLS